MNSKSLILALTLGFVITGCKDSKMPESKVSEETIAKALDGKVDLEEEKNKEEDKKEDEAKKATDENKEEPKFAVTGENLKKIMVDIGEFAPSLARNLNDEDLVALYKKCEKTSEDTGYWDVKDFFFQELAKEYPEQSLKFPLDSIEEKYNWQKSQDDSIGDKFEWERNLMVENGADYNKIWSFSDKEIEDAFHKAYDKDPLVYYNDYVKMAAEILTGTPAEDSEEKGAADPEAYKDLIKFGSNERDYEAIKDAMVSHYEFKKEVVDKIPNKDIDLAYTRAQKRLEETGFGDIGLVFDELGKLYPGASTLYTGKN
ncbi:hypothetical protein [uncultured Anaerococcus sp.]|uniref:hypothetical protein n=1 Tax=uncultured Anaerococcus sp. TaxID=293428 RepID=UPI00288A52A7|nr:hypothetical protein [uncultured Anaerococcus sp.]